MFDFLKSDPKKKLQKEYNKKLEAALHAQRNGRIAEYSQLTAEAEGVLEKIVILDEEKPR